jgi:hypothetical protein
MLTLLSRNPSLISIQQVLEKSSFLNEVGAAIHVAPNATRILKAWGYDLDWLRPVHCEKLQIWNSRGDLVRTPIVGFFSYFFLFFVDCWVAFADGVFRLRRSIKILWACMMSGFLRVGLICIVHCVPLPLGWLMGGRSVSNWERVSRLLYVAHSLVLLEPREMTDSINTGRRGRRSPPQRRHKVRSGPHRRRRRYPRMLHTHHHHRVRNIPILYQ